ncbi:MAG: alkaline phosphatase D family protein [Jatrophihabitans sp.]|uniref:alkaline phosphatase D family protein n=1 Tax=Jatrophihabitans sp. TaxID=1932789 RepID=UPI003916AC5C
MTRLLIGPLLRHVGTTDATVWVETDEPCDVAVLGSHEHTWTVAGHHYALVQVEGLEPGSSIPYEVHLDGEIAWPPLQSDRPPSLIRTQGGGGPLRLAFGSCRYVRSAATLTDRHFTPDSLACFARDMIRSEVSQWPDAFLMLGDQVYADETSAATQRRIRAKRDITSGAKDQVADFEEYTWLYLESWTDPDVRWLLSNVPTAMIFDDHDVRDDWNTSHSWREDMKRTTWWQERIIGGLSSYWVYQHVGNLPPDELKADDLYQRVRTHGRDAEPLLREFAAAADREADGAKGARWSYRRDFGRTRLLMIDSRCGRILADGERSMVSEEEFAWIEKQVDGSYDHLLVGTSLPWLLPRALHDLESWNESLADGRRGPRMASWAEKVRRAADLEHWAAFRRSFERLGNLLTSVGRGEHAHDGRSPATICVLSGDVHHAYVAELESAPDVHSPIYQLTCSPLHNFVPAAMKVTFRVAWSRVAERLVRALLRIAAKVPPATVSWRRLAGPFFGNEVATLVIEGRHAETVLRRSAPGGAPEELIEVSRLTLAG